MRILFAGGGTGGHFFPILAVIRELKEIAEEKRVLDAELFYMGPDEFGRDLLKHEGVTSIAISTGKFRRYLSLQNMIDALKVPVGIFQAVWNMFLVMPDVIFSKGGYGAFPAVVAGIIFRIPIIIHESDAIPGKTNAFTAKFAKRVGVAFAQTAEFFPKEKTALVGIPIRKRILGGSRENAREHFDIFSAHPTVGFIGASQGSQKINDTVLSVLKELTDEFEVIHQTGEKNQQQVKEEAAVILEFAHKERYHLAGFLDEPAMRDFYAASDVIVSRASASSIFEIAAWGKPSILIPLPHAAQDHQRSNAYAYAASGGAVVIEEQNLTAHILLSEIKKIIGNREKMKQMSFGAQKFSRIDAAAIIAKEILALGTHL